MGSACKIYPQHPPAKILRSIQQIIEKNAFQLEDSFTITNTLKKLCKKSKKIFETISSPFQKSYAEEIFEKSLSTISTLETLEKTRIEEDLNLVEEIQNLSKDMDKLDLEFILLDPEEILEKISSLSKQISQTMKKKSYNKNFLDRAIYLCFEKLDSIKFRLDYPIMEELSEYSYQQTFARTLKALANEFLQNKNTHLSPDIKFLSKNQKLEIYEELKQRKNSSEPFEVLWKKSTNEEKAKSIFSFLQKIQYLAELAKTLAYGNIDLFFASLSRVDEKILENLQKMLWQLRSPVANWQKQLQENDLTTKDCVAKALMKLVERAVLL